MPVSSICLDEELRHFVERFRQQFSKPIYQYFMIVLEGLMLCGSRHTLLGMLRQVISVAGLSRLREKALWHEGEFTKQRLSVFRTTMEPAVHSEQEHLL